MPNIPRHISTRTFLLVLFLLVALVTFWQPYTPAKVFRGSTPSFLHHGNSQATASTLPTAVRNHVSLPHTMSPVGGPFDEAQSHPPPYHLGYKDKAAEAILARTASLRTRTKTTIVQKTIAPRTKSLKQQQPVHGSGSQQYIEAFDSTIPKVVPLQSTSSVTPSTPLPSSISSTTSADDGCPDVPGAENILLLMKTGATELFTRVPTSLLTFIRCVPNFMIFSDLAQDVGSYSVYDALYNVSQSYKDSHEDFTFYHELQQIYRAQGDVTKLMEGSMYKEKGWNLDKWKNIPMMHAAYEDFVWRQQKDIRWFVTIDADTYLSITNLARVLATLDHRQPHYIGTIYFHGETAFAQGGTGYIVSRRAVEMLEDIWSDAYVSKWEEETARTCCGDVMMSIALQDAGVNVTSGWPLLQPSAPKDTDWGDWSWCEPSLTWHHIRPFEVEALYEFERVWMHSSAESIYLYRDLFDVFVWPQITARKEDWDNGSHDRTFRKPPVTEAEQRAIPEEGNDWDWKSQMDREEIWALWSDEQKLAVESEENCLAQCERDEGCFQWVWKRHGSCSLNWSVKLGSLQKRTSKNENGEEEDTEEVQMVSGWMVERIEKFKEKMELEGCKPKWKPEGS